MCVSPILAAYFTAPLSKAISVTTEARLTDHKTIQANMHANCSALHPHTLYVDDRSISASAHTREEATKIVKTAFEVAHKWLQTRGLKMDQIKCELIHFTKSNRG